MNYLHPIFFCMVFFKKGSESPMLFWVWTFKCFGHGVWNFNIPHFLDKKNGKAHGSWPKNLHSQWKPKLNQRKEHTKPCDSKASNFVGGRGGGGGSYQKFLPTSHVKRIQNRGSHLWNRFEKLPSSPRQHYPLKRYVSMWTFHPL